MMSWLKERLDQRWNDNVVQQPCKKSSWRLRSGITPICRRIKSRRKHQAIKTPDESAEEVFNRISDYGSIE